MKIFTRLSFFVALVFSLVSCADEMTDSSVMPSESVEVGFVMPIDVTRTTIDTDGKTTRWSEGDKLAVWAKDSEGNYIFDNATFMLRYFSNTFDYAFFTSNIAPMAEGEYTYYISYPLPTSVAGTEATYTLPAQQTGKYEGGYDIMIAEPVVAEALTSSKKMELNTIMRHQMHALKITVPEGRNHHGGRLYRLEITFPNAVVGDIVIDVSNPDAEPTYVNTSNTIVLECPEGFDVGDSLWAFVLPGTVDGDVSYIAKGERRSTCAVSYPLNRDMRAGHVTPMNITIPAELNPYYTSVTFSVDQNNLGEEFNFFDVYDANGNLMGKFTRNAENKYVVDYEGEFDADQYDNTSWRIVFDSEHAVVETTINLGDMTDYTQHTCWMNVPYLFAEDFNGVEKFDYDTSTRTFLTKDAASVAGIDLSQYGITGWTGARVGSADAASIMVGGSTDYVALGATRSYGRLDSPAIVSIKDDKKVAVNVEFTYSFDQGGASGLRPVACVGYTTVQGILNGYATQFNNDEAFSGIDSPSSIDTSASSKKITLKDCTSDTRLTWHVGNMGKPNTFLNIGNGYGRIHIDNIRVSIAK